MMRSLGYALDDRDRWVNGRIRMVAPNPALLTSCDPDQLHAFHDTDLWETSSVAPDPPLLDATLRGELEGIPMTWDGFLGAWLLMDDVWMLPEQLEALGPSGVRACLARYNEMRAQWQSQAQAALMGMVGMVIWVLSGWQFGAPLYVFGLIGITVLTWIFRPKPMPKGIWEGLSPQLLDLRVDDGVRLLGPGWEELADELGAVPVGDTYVHFRTLWRTIRVSTFKRRFTPEGLEAILSALAPVEVED